MNQPLPRIAITPGEPAGIGPELMSALALSTAPAQLVLIADRDLIAARCPQVKIKDYDPANYDPAPQGTLIVKHVPLKAASKPGRLDPENARYVLNTLDAASDGCVSGEFAALVTGPVCKGVIADAGIPFTGHTEYFQQRTNTLEVVMLLGCRELRVALVTTHLPLRQVPDAITPEKLTRVIRILNHDLKTKFGYPKPRIISAGLNPHAGENGHLGDEELKVIIPTFELLRAEGIDLEGPLPADTMFQPQFMRRASAFLTMYHDQGLPVLKYVGFDHGYNTTLGLPYIRTSVDHGTALDLAGSGKADPGSLLCAVDLALSMAKHQAAFTSSSQQE